MTDSLWQDLRYALRGVKRAPGFTVAAVLTLALGIGANAAVFSIVNAVLLRPLPYSDPDRIVTISSALKTAAPTSLLRQVSIPDFEDWRDQSSGFEAMAYYGTRLRSVTIGPSAEYGRVTIVSPDFLRVFEIRPLAGRLFAADEEKDGGSGAALVSLTFAQNHFGDAARALGQTIGVFGGPVAIVGVLPAGFDFPERTEVWFPAIARGDRTIRSALNYLAVGRLKPDVSLERGRLELTAIAARLQKQYPQTNEARSVSVAGLHDQMVGNVRLMLYLLLGAVGLVLLIACANMATLLLARATTRTHEMAVRTALGASRGRIVSQMLLEGLVQALVAGTVGLVLAVWGTEALVALAPGDVPRIADATVDARVLVFTLVVSVAASLLFALAPALQMSQFNIDRTLRLGSIRGGVAGRIGRAREVLVTGQLALSVVLLVTGGLLVKSFVMLQHVSLGFRPENVLVMDATVSTSDPRQDASLFFMNLLTETSTLPGVLASGATMAPPGHVDSESAYWIDHVPTDLNVGARQAVMSIVAPGAFRALDIPLRRGRDFHDGDVREAPLTAIVNETLAREALPGRDPIGHTIFCGFDSLEPMTIVGIVGDVRQSGPSNESKPECYMPYLQHNYNGATLSLVVRTASDPTLLIEPMRRKAPCANNP